MYYLLGRKSKLQATSFSYIKKYSNQSGLNGIQLWDTASTSNIGISKYQQLEKKSASTDLNTELASAHIQTN
jgi:hypothetical protein